ncbi:MAG: DUF1566 domain-containing protein [Methylococcales bacterium]
MKTKLLPLLFFTFTANAADLSTTFSSTYSKITVNNTIAYTGSVVNKGSDTASNVQLLFYMPPKNISIGNLPSGCSNANSKIICSIGDLNVGDSATRTVSVFYTQKGAGFVSVNAITDSNDTNYSNNLTRLTTNITDSTNTANSPLIPNLFSAKVNPTSVVQGNALTFIANLDAPLPSGYSVKVNYDYSNYTMTGSGTNYSLSNTPNNAGLKSFTTGIYDSYGSLKGNQLTGTFEVTKLNTAPTLSLISGADAVTAGSAYTLQLLANDTDGNLSNIQITNWGDSSSDYQNASNNTTLSFSHTFGSTGSYTISATAYDSANASSTSISKTITVSNAVVTPPPATNTGTTTTTSKYTKIANNGSSLPDSAQLGTNPTDWACTKDNNTGLIWEIKTNNGGLRDKDWTYSWYEPDANKNGGFEGSQGTSSNCEKSECNTYAYANAVNTQGLCGVNDWRMPTKNELLDIVKSDTITLLKIDINYFPNTQESDFWSSSPLADIRFYAWSIDFNSGYTGTNDKKYGEYVRLVRG